MSIRIEEITQKHDRKPFDCGIKELNQFLQQQARQKTKRNIAKTYVACLESSPTTIIGYYTLTGYYVITPPEFKQYKNYPHPLNAVKLARLAVNLTNQNQRIGEKLLVDAIYKTVLVSRLISAIGLFIDPMMPEVIPFYQQYGFLSADTGNPMNAEMWLPIGTCIKMLHSH